VKDRIELLILEGLFRDEDYTRKVLPFIQEDYFSTLEEKIVFSSVKAFIDRYNTLPTKEAIVISLNSSNSVNEVDYRESIEYIEKLELSEQPPNREWLLQNTEKWCQDRALYNAISKSIKIIEGNSKDNIHKGAIPQLLMTALGVSFNSEIGHDYINDTDKLFEFYHTEESKIPFDIDMLNKITDGGINKKSLFVLVAGTGHGKSLALCHLSSSFLNQGKNVLYITLEMSEKRIAQRIDANLLNVSMVDLKKIPKEHYDSKVSRMKNKATGRLIIKEYPTASAHVGHFRHLLQELNLKKNFVPDVVVVDYLNIAASSRIKLGTQSNTYVYIKSVAEELRGLAMEFNVPILTATQTNRQGQNNTDLDYEDVSESHGLSATADYILGLTSTEELEKMNQLMFKQIKNRYGDVARYRRFVVGIDRDKMRLFDVDQSAQQNIAQAEEIKDDKPLFDQSTFGSKMVERGDFSKINFNNSDDDDMF
jgi:replicative DNA helicase